MRTYFNAAMIGSAATAFDIGALIRSKYDDQVDPDLPENEVDDDGFLVCDLNKDGEIDQFEFILCTQVPVSEEEEPNPAHASDDSPDDQKRNDDSSHVSTNDDRFSSSDSDSFSSSDEQEPNPIVGFNFLGEGDEGFIPLDERQELSFDDVGVNLKLGLPRPANSLRFCDSDTDSYSDCIPLDGKIEKREQRFEDTSSIYTDSDCDSKFSSCDTDSIDDTDTDQERKDAEENGDGEGDGEEEQSFNRFIIEFRKKQAEEEKEEKEKEKRKKNKKKRHGYGYGHGNGDGDSNGTPTDHSTDTESGITSYGVDSCDTSDITGDCAPTPTVSESEDDVDVSGDGDGDDDVDPDASVSSIRSSRFPSTGTSNSSQSSSNSGNDSSSDESEDTEGGFGQPADEDQCAHVILTPGNNYFGDVYGWLNL
jgi:hypothetical protein